MDIRSYIEDLAKKHDSIKHVEATNKRFFDLDMSEVLFNLPKTVNFSTPLIGWEDSESYGKENNSGIVGIGKRAAFFILKKVDSSQSNEKTILDELEAIGYDFMFRLRDEVANHTISHFRSFDFNSVNMQRIKSAKTDLVAAVYVTFDIPEFTAAAVDKTKWTDLNI